MTARTTPWSCSVLVEEGNLLGQSEQLVPRFQQLVGSALS